MTNMPEHFIVEFLNADFIGAFKDREEAKKVSKERAQSTGKCTRIRTVEGGLTEMVVALTRPAETAITTAKKRQYNGPQRKNTTVIFQSCHVGEEKYSTRVLVAPGEPRFKVVTRAAQRIWGSKVRVYAAATGYNVKRDGEAVMKMLVEVVA